MCVCDPTTSYGYEYVQWIGNVFDTCVYTPREQIAFYFGLLNICLWLVAQFPQLVENYRLGRAESLALGFLVTWLLGDITNFIGCIFTNQSRVQLYTAYYFMFMDCLILGQWTWYFFKNGGKKASDQVLWDPTADAFETPSVEHRLNSVLLGVFGVCSVGGLYAFTKATSDLALTHSTGRVLLGSSICQATVDLSQAGEIIGDIAAWISGVLYFTARFPQMILNYRRQSTEGLSFGLFMMSTAANVFYSFSIILPETTEWGSTSFWENVFPYLLGSAGTVASTAPILWQFFAYRKKSRKSDYHTFEEED